MCGLLYSLSVLTKPNNLGRNQDGHHCANIVLAAGFCERWPKAWRAGFALVLGQLLIMAKNLPLTVLVFMMLKKRTQTLFEIPNNKFLNARRGGNYGN